MGTQSSDANPDTLPTEPRPPFNEISILFPLLTLYTVAYMGLMMAEFILRGTFVVTAGMMPIYIALVGAYAADKEIRRWAVGDQSSRKGALFVYPIFYSLKNACVDNERLTRTTKSCANTFSKPAQSAITAL